MKSLKTTLRQHFFKYALIPLLIIETSLLGLYFLVNQYTTDYNSQLLKQEPLNSTQKILISEAKNIQQELVEIKKFSSLLQKNHEQIFNHPELYIPNHSPSFKVAHNGVFYKSTPSNASLYYSSKTVMSEDELHKAILTEAMDPLLKSVVELNRNVVAAYFNSHDNMNRLYHTSIRFTTNTGRTSTSKITAFIIWQTNIKKLSEQTSQIGNAQDNLKPIHSSIKEIWELSRNFGSMSKELNQRTQKIIEVEVQKTKTEQEAQRYFEQSMTDSLTAVFNLSKIQQDLHKLINQFKDDTSKIFSVIYIDIDHFKHINDTFGHAQGDHVLIDFAKILQTHIRHEDIVGRIGGEEFVIITKTDKYQAYKMAEYLREKVEAYPFQIKQPVTSSFGVAEIHQEDIHSFNDILLRADQALYQAKSTGRNKVVAS